MGGYPPAPTTRNFYRSTRDAVIRVYDKTGNVIETREYPGEFKEF